MFYFLCGPWAFSGPQPVLSYQFFILERTIVCSRRRDNREIRNWPMTWLDKLVYWPIGLHFYKNEQESALYLRWLGLSDQHTYKFLPGFASVSSSSFWLAWQVAAAFLWAEVNPGEDGGPWGAGTRPSAYECRSAIVTGAPTDVARRSAPVLDTWK